MKKNPKISVVTVTYNCVGVLENTLKSVISQKYSNVEYIVIDGKSSDGTLNLIDRYKDHISVLVSEPDKGIFDAMNKAIKLVTGDWILFMNAGDTFVDDNVLASVFSLSVDSNVGVVFGDAYFKSKSGLSLYHGTPFYKKKERYKGMGICHQSIFVRSDLAKLNPFNLSYKYTADYNMMMSIYNKGYKFLETNIVISIYDLTGVSTLHCVGQFKEVYKICGLKKGTFLYCKLLIINKYRELKIKIKNLIV